MHQRLAGADVVFACLSHDRAAQLEPLGFVASLEDQDLRLVSEENEQPVTIDHSETGKYIVVFDPLDGSSNIDVNVSVGTIFSILRRAVDPDGTRPDVIQPRDQVADGGLAGA